MNTLLEHLGYEECPECGGLGDVPTDFVEVVDPETGPFWEPRTYETCFKCRGDGVVDSAR